MTASATAPAYATLDAQRDLNDLRAQTLNAFVAGLFVLANAWVIYVTFVAPGLPFISQVPPLGLFLACGIVFGVGRSNPMAACRLLPVMLMSVVVFYLSLDPHSLALFFSVPVLVIASVVMERRWMVALTLVTCLLLLLIMQQDVAALGATYVVAILINLITALAMWLASHNLYMAVEWAMYSHAQAQESIAALRERRAELGQITAMLRGNQERMHYLNVRLEQARVAAEEAYRTKQHFVANVSHELRTPLNLITGFSEMMAFSPESYGGLRLPPTYREDVMEIYRSSKHLLGLVEDVLALAQLESGQMIVQRDWANLGAVVHEATDTLRPLIEAKGLRLEVEAKPEEPVVFVDAGRVRQVLLNLLNNAYRFTESGGIRVAMAQAGAEVVIQVADSGVGIPEQELPRIFEEFHSLSGGPSARRDGFGLGLSISRRLAEAHGGRLWAESQVGVGSTFFLALPLGQAPALNRPTLVRTAAPVAQESSKPVILAVSPHPLGDQYDRYLSEYRVVHTTPQQALAAYERYLPVAVWVNDTTTLAEPPRYLAPVLRVAPTLPIIACRVPSSAETARQLDADLLLTKPITRDKLEEALRELAGDEPIRSVLVVDDDPRMVRLVERILMGLPEPPERVIEACGGREGLELLLSEHPDLVLLDLAMPEVTGYDLLEAIRHNPATARQRIALITGVTLEQESAPVYSISVQSQEGFTLARSLSALNEIVKGLAPRAVV
jgi:signal transduction histidine kinase/CheY-like chemotaxis protein